jgi:hypothetical protein
VCSGRVVFADVSFVCNGAYLVVFLVWLVCFAEFSSRQLLMFFRTGRGIF